MLENIKISKGTPSPLGLTFHNTAANFAVFSQNATAVFLGLFSENNPNPEKQIPLQRTGDVWHVEVDPLPKEGMTYAYRCEGPYDVKKGFLFKSDVWLGDPYAKALSGPTRARIIDVPKFDWQGDKSPKIPRDQLVIYEMHVRGFTQHPSSSVSHPGTFLGIVEKIPYLKEFGVNAVEIMPIFELDEMHCKFIHPGDNKPLTNYWGYHSLYFFAPKRSYAHSDPINEFKTVVRELHKNGIEVILDVVYNHTGEEDDINYYVNFRGLDNSVYYQINEVGNYLNFSGCGNTINCNHPVVQQLILDSLRYWVEEMHVDGFRFDSAAVFMRDPKGRPLLDPPILKAIAADPVINKVKLVAESWDSGGLIEIGSFAKSWLWSEWNSHYRDVVRRFIKGTDAQATEFGKVLTGSEEVYGPSKTPLSSINYVSSHDGFSLRDLVTYSQKHNEENGEGNKDGANDNDSWNCGAEGPIDNKEINALRDRQMRNFLLTLFVSQGIPMILMGDECGHSRLGNNNPWTQDNPLNWFLWDELGKDRKIFHYVRALAEFRRTHPDLHRDHYLTKNDIEWHGMTPSQPDWGDKSRFIAFKTTGNPPVYVAFNAFPNPVKITLPPNVQWHLLVNTAEDWTQHHLLEPDKGAVLSTSFEMANNSVILATG